MNKNIVLSTDSYKLSHSVQYPQGTEKVFSYLEARQGAKYSETVFFGLQYFLKEYLEGQVVTREKIEEAKKIADIHVGPGIFNYDGWNYILEKHNGRLPVKIKAVDEGSVIPIDNVLMTIENTDPKCFWLTNYLETLLVQLWFPCTVATQSREIKKIIIKYLNETGNPGLIDFKLHCFGFRGVSSVESAGIGGAAHLINFMGTDTIAGLLLAMNYYNSDVCAYSIPASEHSTITSWGRENESQAMLNMLTKYPKGLVACVSDSYNIENACSNIWGDELKEEVLKREGVLVVRPDSGDPVSVDLDVIKRLGDKFGFHKNEKGYLVLNDKVRVIQGDGVNINSIANILEALKQNGLSADNIAFGMGGAGLQQVHRDVQRFAMKCCAVQVNGIMRDVSKNPITDSTKASKAGQLALTKINGKLTTVKLTEETEKENLLHTVFEDGKITKECSFSEVRNNAKIME